jgi:hypothetical protein
MKKLVFIFLFSIVCNAITHAQSINAEQLQKQIDQSKAQLKQMQHSIDSGIANKNKYYDSINNARNIQNLENFTKQYQANEKTKKRNAFIRIGIGVAFAIIFIIGMLRKRKK